ncbi:MAG: hypothetical protein RMJ66_07785 [Bacteroidia bacterium]|nr:hypothetical protein [Bacteroidia bacterium]MDW8134948.1 hypothetical protein [Bacteroidia bacterium]
MLSTKRYYTLQEVAALLRIPLHQARRWVKLFLDLPSHKTLRIPAESLCLLRKVREGVYLHHLRGEALSAFVQGQKTAAPPLQWSDYSMILSDILQDIEQCLQDIEASMPPTIEGSPLST